VLDLRISLFFDFNIIKSIKSINFAIISNWVGIPDNNKISSALEKSWSTYSSLTSFIYLHLLYINGDDWTGEGSIYLITGEYIEIEFAMF